MTKEAISQSGSRDADRPDSSARSLRDVDFFKEIDDATLALLERHLTHLAVRAGGQLFAEGDESDALFVVVSGRLEVRVVEGATESFRPVAQIGAGEVVGELGVLTGERRSAGAWAVRDTELIMLGRAAFETLMKESPQSIVSLSRLIARRLVNETSSRKPQPAIRTVCLVPLSADLPLDRLRDIVASSLEETGTLRTVQADCADHTSDWFHQQEERHDSLLYVAEGGCSVWTQLCVRQSDLILLVVKPGDRRPGDDVIAYLNEFTHGRICHLVTLQAADRTLPEPAPPWTREISVRTRWNIDLDSEEGRGRLARIASGRTVGLVLSGGGARGFAHLGVVKAIRELGMPIDQIGGTSMGALLAGGFAMGWSVEVFRERLYATFIDVNPVGDYTIPLHSFARGRRLSNLLSEHFGDAEACSLWLPFFCTASNLTRGDAVRLDDGPAWRAIRASLSIPGLVPPVLNGRDVLVDGGLINNLPIDEMVRVNLGPVIGVDVGRAEGSFTLDPEVCEAGGRERMLPSITSPSIVGVLMRSATVAGESNNRSAEDMADHILYPDVAGVSILHWKAIDQMIDRGYECVTAAGTVDALKSVCNAYGLTCEERPASAE
ncbi:MAG: patatin-like phospholipase family protein [Pseudomonadota bacterium]